MKSFTLVLLILTTVLLVKWSVFAAMMSDNLEALVGLQTWTAETKDLSQIICIENSQNITLNETAPAPRSATNSYTAIVIAARQAYFSGDCDNALAYWKLALEKDPFDTTAATMQFLSSGLDRRLLSSNISTANMALYLSRLGLLAEQHQAPQNAEYWFAGSFELYPARAVAMRLIPYRQSTEEKMDVWQKLAKSLTSENADHWWALGQHAELRQEWVQALDAYEAGAGIASEPYEFLMKQGAFLILLDRLDEAEVIAKEGASIEPDKSQPYILLGEIFGRRGEYETAMTWFEQAEKFQPDKFWHNHSVGHAYHRLGNFIMAEEYLRKAIEINPKSSSTMYLLSLAVYQNGKTEQAQTRLESAILLDGAQNWKWLVTLGDWRIASNDLEGALEAYYQALHLQPENSNILNKIKKTEILRIIDNKSVLRAILSTVPNSE